MKKYKFILFALIIFITPNVFARDYNINSQVYYQASGVPNTYGADEIMLQGQTSPWTIGTRYQGCISKLTFYTNFNFSANTTYRITLNMATQDWRKKFMGPQVFRSNSDGTLPSTNNNNMVTSSITYVSNYKIYFYFKTGSTLSPWTYFNIYSTNYMTTCMTGETNWNLSSIIISDSIASTPTPAPVTPTPTPTPQPNNQDIINNNTQNTQDIINNNNQNSQSIIDSSNQNTQDVIDNSNQNTQDIIDNQNKNQDKTNNLLGVCYKNIFNIFDYDYSSSRYSIEDLRSQYAIRLTANGNYTGGSFPVTYHLILKPNTTYYFKKGNSDVVGTARLNYYVYRGSPSGTLVTYTNSNEDFYFTTPITDYKDYYLRIYVTGTQTQGERVVFQRPMLFETNNLIIPPGMYNTFYLPYNEEKCTSKLDATTSAINDVNDTMKDDNIDDNTGFFTNFEDNDHGLTSIITIPLSTIQQLTSTSCVPLQLPIPFTNNTITLPCMTQVYQNTVPTIFSLWQVVSFGIIAYLICLDIFHIVKGFKDPNEDKVEVLDL